jgi:hypothetical protein
MFADRAGWASVEDIRRETFRDYMRDLSGDEPDSLSQPEARERPLDAERANYVDQQEEVGNDEHSAV